MDTTLTHDANHLLVTHDLIADPVQAYVGAAELLFLGMLVLALLFAPTRRAAVAAGLSAGLALALAQVVSHLVNRPRPFVAHPGAVHVLLQHASDSGFPSDHATAAFAIGAALFLRHRRWGLVTLVAAAVLAVGRVAVGVHYPSDVLAGAVLGSLAALALHAPPLRRAIDRVADVAGRPVDRAIAAIAPSRP
jgi:undecaprenyl-diphosphatase